MHRAHAFNCLHLCVITCNFYLVLVLKMDITDTIILAGISAAILVLKKVRIRRAKHRRSIWMKNYFKTRNFEIIKELEYNDNVLFKNFTRMSRTSFYMLLRMVEPKIAKKSTRFRDAIPAKIKLAITLRYLATGDSFMSLMYLFKVSKQFISSMIPGVLKAIIEVLQEYIKLPVDEQEWRAIADEYATRWNFPHCIGSLDGKHVVIQRPENTVGEFHNYKGTDSIVLMAIVDANYRFIYVNVGCQGRISDGGVFRNTEFYKRLENKDLELPQDEALPGRTIPVSFTLVADDAFPLTRHIMKPYATDLNQGSSKRVFNYRLSRARRTVENAFGLLASVFRIFRKPIEIKIENTIVDIVLCCVYLHNFLRSRPDSARYYSPQGCFDNEDASTGEIIPGSWRQITADDTGLRSLRLIPRNASRTAKDIREDFMNYFMSPEGSISHQNKYL